MHFSRSLSYRGYFKCAQSPTDSVLCRDQLQALGWMHALLESDLDDPIKIVAGCHSFYRVSNASGVPCCLQIRPSLRNLPVGEKQLTHIPRGLGHLLAVGLAELGRERGEVICQEHRQPKFQTLLHQAGFKHRAVVPRRSEPGEQKVEARGWVL